MGLRQILPVQTMSTENVKMPPPGLRFNYRDGISKSIEAPQALSSQSNGHRRGDRPGAFDGQWHKHLVCGSDRKSYRWLIRCQEFTQGLLSMVEILNGVYYMNGLIKEWFSLALESAENAMSDPRILFVDDDRDILAMVEQYLTIKGYDVTTVDNGIEAVGIVKEKQIDIVFTDYKMPEFNGLELLVAIKKYRPQTEVIIVTGYGSMESAIQAMKFGSYDYLQKPFKLDHLRLIIDRIVEEKKIKDKAQLIRKIPGSVTSMAR
jgi:CheY-like chemotaxis protein